MNKNHYYVLFLCLTHTLQHMSKFKYFMESAYYKCFNHSSQIITGFYGSFVINMLNRGNKKFEKRTKITGLADDYPKTFYDIVAIVLLFLKILINLTIC